MKLEFEPFGPEWEKEMMKLPKKMLIDMLRALMKKNLDGKKTIFVKL